MKVETHKTFEYLLQTTACKPEAVIGFRGQFTCFSCGLALKITNYKPAKTSRLLTKTSSPIALPVRQQRLIESF
jgi:hypothetical protein